MTLTELLITEFTLSGQLAYCPRIPNSMVIQQTVQV